MTRELRFILTALFLASSRAPAQSASGQVAGMSGHDSLAIRAACETTGQVMGPGEYNACLARQTAELRNNPAPSFAGVPAEEGRSIKASCETTRQVMGPGAYNSCLTRRIAELMAHPTPSVADTNETSRISAEDGRAIRSACETTGQVMGPGAYNACVTKRTAELIAHPSPSFVGISETNRRWIEDACKTTRDVMGPGAYNACLERRISELRKNPSP